MPLVCCKGIAVKYSYAVAEHLFIVELPAGKENWIEDLVQCYAPFLVTTHDEDKALFELSAELGDIVTPSSPYQHVASVQPTDLAFEVWRNEKGDYAIIVSDEEGTSKSLVYTDASFRKASVVISSDAAKPSVLLNNAIMLCYAFAGAYEQTLLVHASVPQIGTTAFLFQGLSGTGKSTHSHLWRTHIPQVELLNDDNPVVRIAEDGKVSVWGTPWSGKTPCYRNVRCDLGGILRLQQSPENNIRRLRPVEAFASLLSSCSTMLWDKSSYNAICSNVERVVGLVPAYHLQCLPNREAAELSHRYLCAENNV